MQTVRLLLSFGADPYARDDNQENAFDKCCRKRMKKLLKSCSQGIRNKNKNCFTGSAVTQEVTINSTPAKGLERSEKNSMENIHLQETERKQKSLLTGEPYIPVDAEKYVAETCHIQEVLNDKVTQKNNEKDSLEQYRASMCSIKRRKLQHGVSQLTHAQKSLLKKVCNTKMTKKIKAYQQMKRSHSNETGQGSSLRYCAKSLERNPISGLLTHNEGHNASRANGSTMATQMPAVCILPDSESNPFQSRFISSSTVSGTRDIPVGTLASERTGQQSSNLTFDDIPLGAENGLSGLDPYSNLTHADSSDADDHVGFTESGNRSPYSVLVNSTINIADKNNVALNKFSHQTVDKRQQISDIHQPSESTKLKEPDQQEDRAVSCGFGEGSENGRPQWNFSEQSSTSLERCMESHTVTVQANTKQQICVGTERRINKIPIRQLISTGRLKPGKDALTFQLQDYSHKGTLLSDGRIKDCSGQIHRDASCWIRALLGNNISVSCKYVLNKVTHCGKKLISFMTEEDFAPKELNHPYLQSQTASLPILRNPMYTVVQVKDILQFDESDFFPSHIMDQIWDEFLNIDELDL